MEYTKIYLNKAHIKKIRYKNNAIIVYTDDRVYVCKKGSEKDVNSHFVEYVLKGKSESNAK